MRPRTCHASSGNCAPSTVTLPEWGRSSVASTRKQRRLAGAVGPEHDKRLARVERERDVLERRAFTVVAGQPVELDGRHGVLDCYPARRLGFEVPHAQAQTVERRCSCSPWARAISSRTFCSRPSRSSSTGSGSPFTIPSKNCLRSW